VARVRSSRSWSSGLVERCLAAGECLRALGHGGVDGDDGVTDVGHAGGVDGAQGTQADDRERERHGANPSDLRAPSVTVTGARHGSTTWRCSNCHNTCDCAKPDTERKDHQRSVRATTATPNVGRRSAPLQPSRCPSDLKHAPRRPSQVLRPSLQTLLRDGTLLTPCRPAIRADVRCTQRPSSHRYCGG